MSWKNLTFKQHQLFKIRLLVVLIHDKRDCKKTTQSNWWQSRSFGTSEQWKTDEAPEISTLLGIMLISEGLKHIYHKVNMKKQKVVFLKVDESTLVENFADLIDQNYPENSNMKEQK